MLLLRSVLIDADSRTKTQRPGSVWPQLIQTGGSIH
jgi:hypothetical protein